MDFPFSKSEWVGIGYFLAEKISEKAKLPEIWVVVKRKVFLESFFWKVFQTIFQKN